MKFRCERDVLAKAIAPVGRAVTTRPATPILSGLHLRVAGDVLTITATDGDLSIRNDVTVSGLDDGVAVLPAKLFGEVVKAMPPGPVELTLNESEARLTAGRTSVGMTVLPEEQFPQLSGPSGEGVTLDTAELADALRQVVPAASKDPARPVLGGVLLEADGDNIQLVATDSYRLAVRSVARAGLLADGQSVLVPATVLAEVSRAIATVPQVTLHLGERQVFFRAGDLRFAARLISGAFPAYKSLIPTSRPNAAVLPSAALGEALKRVKLLAVDAAPVLFAFEADKVTLSAVANEIGSASEEVEIVYSGDAMTIGMNPDYLRAGIDAVNAETVRMSLMSAIKPILIGADADDSLTYVVMPVRVS